MKRVTYLRFFTLAFLLAPSSALLLAASKLEQCLVTAQSSTQTCQDRFTLSMSVQNGQNGTESITGYKLSTGTDASGRVYALEDEVEVYLAKSQIRLQYPLTYEQLFNNKPHELILRSDSRGRAFNFLTNPCSDGLDSGSATCGYALDAAGRKIAGSQGFCCRCSVEDYLGGIAVSSSRGGLSCGLLSSSDSQSAHCLRFDPLWHSAYAVGPAQVRYSIDVVVSRCRRVVGAQQVGGGNSSSSSGSGGNAAAARSCELQVVQLSPSSPVGCIRFEASSSMTTAAAAGARRMAAQFPHARAHVEPSVEAMHWLSSLGWQQSQASINTPLAMHAVSLSDSSIAVPPHAQGRGLQSQPAANVSSPPSPSSSTTTTSATAAAFCDVQVSLEGDFAAFDSAPSWEDRLLLIPTVCDDFSLCGQRVTAAAAEQWLLLDRSLISPSGSDCNKVGVSYAAFSGQGSRCGVPTGSCLGGQPQQLYDQAMAELAEGRLPRNMLAGQLPGGYSKLLAALYEGSGGSAVGSSSATSSISSDASSPSRPRLEFATSRFQKTLVSFSIAADSVRYSLQVSPGRVLLAHVASFEALSNAGVLTVRVSNAGAVAALFTTSVTCSSGILQPVAQQLTLDVPSTEAVTAMERLLQVQGRLGRGQAGAGAGAGAASPTPSPPALFFTSNSSAKAAWVVQELGSPLLPGQRQLLFQLMTSSTQAEAYSCQISLLDAQGSVTDSHSISFDTSSLQYRGGNQQASLTPGAPTDDQGVGGGAGAGRGGSCQDKCSIWDLLCAIETLCLSRLIGWGVGVAAGLAGLALLAKFPWLITAPLQIVLRAAGALVGATARAVVGAVRAVGEGWSRGERGEGTAKPAQGAVSLGTAASDPGRGSNASSTQQQQQQQQQQQHHSRPQDKQRANMAGLLKAAAAATGGAGGGAGGAGSLLFEGGAGRRAAAAATASSQSVGQDESGSSHPATGTGLSPPPTTASASAAAGRRRTSVTAAQTADALHGRNMSIVTAFNPLNVRR